VFHFISVNGDTYSCFSHPCDFMEGEKEEIELSALLFDDSQPQLVEDSNSKCFLIQSSENNWSYEGVGKVIALNPLILDFNGLAIDLDGEIENLKLDKGDFVKLTIGRLDGSQS